MTAFKTSLAATLIATTLAGAGTAVTTAPAEAHCFGCAVGAGVAGGLLLGGLLSAAAEPRYQERIYVEDAPRCTVRYRNVYDGYHWHHQRVTTCP